MLNDIKNKLLKTDLLTAFLLRIAKAPVP